MGRATRVLIVDDDSDFREALREVLEAEGCIVHEAADGVLAMETLHDAPLPDLILLDLRMPAMNGWKLYEELQKDPTLAAIPVAVLSAAASERPAGNMHVLNKPIDLPNLLGLLRAIEAPDRPVTAVRLHPR